MCIVIGILSIIIILGFILVIIKRLDEVQPINNSDGQIICGIQINHVSRIHYILIVIIVVIVHIIKNKMEID